MALELRQSLGLVQQLVMTPQLQQAIKLLQLSRLELLETVSQEMEENPILEEMSQDEVDGDDGAGEKKEESTRALQDSQEKKSENPSGDDAGPDPDSPSLPEVTVEERTGDDVDWESYLSEYSSGYSENFSERHYEQKDAPSFENFTATKTDLSSHLLWQLNMSSVKDEKKEIGAHIIGNLNDDGYLKTTLDEISQATGDSIDDVREVLALIQNFDPVGVAARDTRECLLIQALFQDLAGTLVEKIIRDHLKDLEEKRYRQVADQLDVSIQDFLMAVTAIQALDPKPGRIYAVEETIYVTPDIYVSKVGDGYEIIQNEDGLPKLRINAYYKRMLKNRGRVSDETKAYIQEKMRSAAWLIKSIHQRQRTLYRVTESIVRFQKQFLDKGIAYLRPLVLRDVAEDIEMHESTVSRVTTSKYVHTPQGLYELKFFFNSAINRVDGDSLASESVKEQIRKIIKAEDKTKPLSDKGIENIMHDLNIRVARRTVAKYREAMGILPSRKRKEVRIN
ncbi:MAG: RNA polymerase factor sigma-54 [Deltaproteobacteria bacterium]|nr:RNA polymerase factor sigma-54 [Deltaproteobacteria bacterium]